MSRYLVRNLLICDGDFHYRITDGIREILFVRGFYEFIELDFRPTGTLNRVMNIYLILKCDRMNKKNQVERCHYSLTVYLLLLKIKHIKAIPNTQITVRYVQSV